jgi:predicted ABC-type ATPase
LIRKSGPAVVALAGANGAGKSTSGPVLLRDTLGITEFVNADVIAQGLSAFDPERAAIAAGRVMLARLRELADRRVDFGFETTLAGRAYAGWIKELRRRGYSFHLIYLWLRNVDLAIKRVGRRVDLGGHDVPEETIRRRYRVGLVNFFGVYRPLAKTWRFYDNSFEGEPVLIAEGTGSRVRSIRDRDTWLTVRRGLKSR